MSVSSQPNGGKGASVKTRPQASTKTSALADVRRLERLLAGCEWDDQRLFARARKRASARALEVL